MLVTDPCSLLAEITEELCTRWRELAQDPDQGGKITDQSRCEARLALTLEALGILEPIVTRPSSGDALDGYGQVWDFKGPHSQQAIQHRIEARSGLSATPPVGGFKGEYHPETEVLRAIGQQQIGNGIVFDLRRLTVQQAQDLVAAVSAEPSIDPALLRFYPRPADLASFQERADGS